MPLLPNSSLPRPCPCNPCNLLPPSRPLPTPQIDRERLPERVVHARGASAKGFFEVTHDVSHLTCADFLRAPGVQTPLIARFSTVIHERGSPETLRDPRGFAVKFYTREGNFDMVGNNVRNSGRAGRRAAVGAGAGRRGRQATVVLPC